MAGAVEQVRERADLLTGVSLLRPPSVLIEHYVDINAFGVNKTAKAEFTFGGGWEE